MNNITSRLAAYLFLLLCHSVVFVAVLGLARGGEMLVGHDQLRTLGSLLLFSIVVTGPLFFAALVIVSRNDTSDAGSHVGMGALLGAVGYAIGGAITYGGLLDAAVLGFQGGLVGAIIGLAYSAIDSFLAENHASQGQG